MITTTTPKVLFVRLMSSTGEKVWQFDPIPRPGQFGNDTWLDNSWERNGNTGVWTQITVDEKNELVFLAVEITCF